MKKITFHGILKALGKKTYSVKASSWKEICEFLQANVRNYSAIRKRMLEDLDGCYFVVDGKTVESSEVLDKRVKEGENIEVIPVVAMCAVAFAVFMVKMIIMIVVSMAISMLVAKMMTPKDPKQLKTSSYITARNTPIPMGYGRLRVAPPVVNVMQVNRDLVNI
jgi:molybdopterin converting factor small subunit